MSGSASEPGRAEPAYAPYRRFARDVLIVDLAMGAVVLALSWWQEWTSVEESTAAIFVGGAVLIGLAILPFVAQSLGAAYHERLTPGSFTDFTTYQALRDPGFTRFPPRLTATVAVAGVIPVAYAILVRALFLW